MGSKNIVFSRNTTRKLIIDISMKFATRNYAPKLLPSWTHFFHSGFRNSPRVRFFRIYTQGRILFRIAPFFSLAPIYGMPLLLLQSALFASSVTLFNRRNKTIRGIGYDQSITIGAVVIYISIFYKLVFVYNSMVIVL